jgi:glycerol kinase
LAASADPSQQVYLVPAFTGLGAPHWDSEARAAIFGLTRGATRKEIVRAALESVGYQTRDLIDAMRADSRGLWGAEFASVIRIDGGMSASDWTMQFLADILDSQVDRPEIFETTALGAGYLAGWRAGLYPDPEQFSFTWRRQARFTPSMAPRERESRYRGWRDAVARTVLRPEI